MEILRAAATQGDIWVFETMRARWVRSGTVNFEDQSDPAFAAEYFDALDRLESKDLVRYQSGQLYGLTGRGFRVARALVEG